MNKNNVIFLLFVAALLGSTWGAVVNRQKIDMAEQLRDARAELEKRSEQLAPGKETPGKAADSRDNRGDLEAQLVATRKELAEKHRKTQMLEAKLAEQTAAIENLSKEKDALAEQIGSGELDDVSLPEAWPPAQDGEGAQQRLAELNAQLLGLEKIVEEKNEALRQAAQEKERLQINMDVLLAKIADQQRELLASKEENRELVKQLAAGEERVDLREQQPADRP